MLLFIPATDYATQASAASSIDALDFEFVKAANQKSLSFRIGNNSATATSFTLLSDDNRISVSPSTFDLAGDEISDTVSITLTLPLEIDSRSFTAELTATTGESLAITYETVGANFQRRRQYPDRSGNPTDISGNVITALGDTLLIYRYEPIGHDGRTLEPGTRFRAEKQSGTIDGTLARFKALDFALTDRLDGHNQTVGYQRTEETIVAQFQREARSIVTTNLTADNSPLRYVVAATLLLPAEYELIRTWGLFQAETTQEPAQYKRTVYIVPRQGEWFSVENIRTLDFSDSLSHFECDLVALHNREMGSPDFWNPWSISYQNNEDKPYAVFPCPYVLPVEAVDDASGSAAT